MPIARHTESRSIMLFDFVRPEPMCSPIGVIARSAPRLKRPIPSIRKIVDTKNIPISAIEKFISGVKFSKKTIAVTGKTEIRASIIFLNNIFFN
jgi:hypothetical protein